MSESVNTPDLNGILGNLLANPAALSGMMNLIGNMRLPQSDEKGSQAAQAEEQPTAQKSETQVGAGAESPNLAALAPLLSGMSALTPVKKDTTASKSDEVFDPMKRRRCLLEAIRPYLSPARCENLNLLLRILDVFSLLSSKK